MDSQSSCESSFSGVPIASAVTTHGVIFPCAFSNPRDCSSCRSASVKPLVAVGNCLPFTSTISRGASSSAWICATGARSGTFPAET